MRVDAFDFELPETLIALRPSRPRDSARLLVIKGASLEDATIRDLPHFLRAGDMLVVNDTRVIPARLMGIRGARSDNAPAIQIECLLHLREGPVRWRAFARPAKRLRTGDTLTFDGGLTARVETRHEGGEISLQFQCESSALEAAISVAGRMPLPPYIESRRATDEADRADYQTVYARADGAVAAPTAGLHFTPELLATLKTAGVGLVSVTLHVGAATFLPVKVDDIKDHVMHPELGEITPTAAQDINAARRAGGRIVAVGTTALRLLESALAPDGSVRRFKGPTSLFITPGYPVRAADLLLTNFHLPRSTLVMLVQAFGGVEPMRRAYAHAIASGYRFYSYGDACLIERAPHG